MLLPCDKRHKLAAKQTERCARANAKCTPGLWLVALCTLVLFDHAHGQTPRSEPKLVSHNLYLLPDAQASLRILAQPASLFWEQQPLRAGLEDLSQTYSISVWLDRRIDPSKKVDCRVPVGGNLRDVFEAIGQTVEAEVGLVGGVLYFGPPQAASAAQWSAVQTHDKVQGAGTGTAPSELKPLTWPEITSSNGMTTLISETWDYPIQGTIPHDLLHAGSLPPSTLATQLSLISTGFGLSPKIESRQAVLEAAAGPGDSWRYAYDSNDLNELASNRAGRALARSLNGKIQKVRDKIIVSGPSTLHTRLLSPRDPRPSNDNLLANRFALEVVNKPTKYVVESLASSFGLKVQWDIDSESAAANRLVSFQVSDANLDEMLETLSHEAELEVRRTPGAIRVGNPK